ncbi:MAG: hypothetical protein WD638_06055 [Nitriliruptoraceae bacterium]
MRRRRGADRRALDRRALGRRALGRWVLIGGALALLAVGCTADTPEEPAPSPAIPEDEEDGSASGAAIGARVEVVLPAAGELDRAVTTALAARIRALEDDLPDGIGSLRVHVPDDVPFVGDLTELLAARGHELLCVVGADAASVAEPVADRHRAISVCALPAAPPEPGDEEEAVLPTTASARVDLPVEELGVLAGAAARAAAETRAEAEADRARAEAEAEAAARAEEEEDDEDEGDEGDEGDAPAPEPPPPIEAEPPMVGLVLGGDELPSDRFREGVLHGLVGAEVVEAEDLSAPTVDQLEAVLAAGAHVVLIDGAPGAVDVLEALDGRAGIVAPTDVAAAVTEDGGPPRELVLSYRLRLEVALAQVLTRYAGQGGLPSPMVLPLRDDLLSLEPGPSGQGVASALEEARQDLSSEPDPDTTPPEGPAATRPVDATYAVAQSSRHTGRDDPSAP